MKKLTQDDFIPQYMDISSHSAYDGEYPKIVNWVSSLPITYGLNFQCSCSVLQRKMNEGDPWEFIPSLRISDPSLALSNDAYSTDRYADVANTVLGTCWSFDDAINEMYDTLARIVKKYC